VIVILGWERWAKGAALEQTLGMGLSGLFRKGIWAGGMLLGKDIE
jgi:hypothetical protein